MLNQIKQWRKYSGEYLELYIEEEVKFAILREKDLGHQLKVCIGTDSQVKGVETEFATVIVFLRKGNGGFMYMNNEVSREKMTITQRMMNEVAKSVEIAHLLSEMLSVYKVDMEVHVDINTQPCFKSHAALKDAIGYITGMGFVFKAKPDAFASTCCANKLVQ
jgi:predicted RNase H-related nuclease YkuK (DUF458 family)